MGFYGRMEMREEGVSECEDVSVQLPLVLSFSYSNALMPGP